MTEEIQSTVEAAPLAEAEVTPATDNPAPADPMAIYHDPMPDLFGGSVRPVEYEFEQPQHGDALPLEMQIEARNALAAEGIPKDLGNEFVRRWNTAAKPADTATLELGMAQTRSQLEAVYREQTDEVLTLARGEAARMMKRLPWIRPVLESTPLGNDVWLIGTLANLARQRQAKGG